mmetsp:Transcript_54322/g.175640  ORF Transcript_54322/g.175640 Transcript_54322/m.175640 type:complete len:115 (+) Transcript_54322:789-1133(+)
MAMLDPSLPRWYLNGPFTEALPCIRQCWVSPTFDKARAKFKFDRFVLYFEGVILSNSGGPWRAQPGNQVCNRLLRHLDGIQMYAHRPWQQIGKPPSVCTTLCTTSSTAIVQLAS